ncbi:Na(+)-translocating NADH-quinone reductase subunit A [Neisseriaceae bacterium PsAf]|nr:Na(+)-translocating NADH-quinone reductase subunit A [Neisseriaceae bacterium PsAf]
MSTIKIKKGLDLKISGTPQEILDQGKKISKVAILGQDFIGMRPGMAVKEGDRVSKGQVLFRDKDNEGVNFLSPVHGTVIEINRGEKRVLQSVVIAIESGREPSYDSFLKSELTQLSAEKIQAMLLETGLWIALRTRPYSKIPRIDAKPSSIFVSLIDSNPLALNPEVVVNEYKDFFEAGLIVLQKLRDTPIHVAKQPDYSLELSDKLNKVQLHNFKGIHPVGLVGTHIHFIDPVGQDKQVWHLNYQDVIAIGKLFLTGELDNTRIISLAGPEVKNPRYIRTILGASLDELTQGELSEHVNRVISGSVFNGTNAVGPYAYLGRYHLQISVLLEGDFQEFLGWIAPNSDKYSITRTTLGHFRRKKSFDVTTSINGSERAMVPIGTYERVMPLDILATPLLRDLIVGDTDEAQDLGCLELDEEDLALCTYVCPGKYEYGTLLREALTKIEEEG